MRAYIYQIPRTGLKEKDYNQILHKKDNNLLKNDITCKKLAAVLLQLNHKNDD